MPIYPSEQFRPGQPTPAPRPQRPAPSLKGHPDIRSTKEYKLAARRWTSTIVALPFLMYTSYILYERSKFFYSLPGKFDNCWPATFLNADLCF
ncbi:hypothetical protein N7520_001373 [Penicillium odoratum]|uniref:uncharacterized protein n=1 Tax=Penicillium odoratum TaxID=1167516 RepID=UPI00254906A7|nr:uncharacterized protein N7520_001373 [Penicillium odoratum]KAJ5778127.1 hypothetical protein N7520_001373 [Penicillium odoratum]